MKEIRAHHQRAIDRLVAEYVADLRFQALIIGGSVAKGCAREDSDIDFLIVANDQEYDERQSRKDLFINRKDLCDYPGGFVDGKIVNHAYLNEVARKGNEPSRAAFDGAFVAFSHIADLDDLLNQIHVYPEKGHDERLCQFYSMAFIQHWLMAEADRHDNVYTKARAASQLALYAGRLILAYNRVLFPYHKWFLHYLEKCPQKPDDFMANIKSLLEAPSLTKAGGLFKSLQEFHSWGVTDHDAFYWFMTEVEWSWMKGQTPLEDV